MIGLAFYRLIRVSGPDRLGFLQGQLTQDMQALRAGTWALAGWADPRGRLLMVARAICRDDAVLLMVPGPLFAPLSKRLSLYVMRARVGIGEESALAMAAEIPAAETARTDAAQLPAGHEPLEGPDAGRFRLLLGPASGHTAAEQPDPAWVLANIQAGIGEVLPETSGEFLPQMLNLDLLGAISFSKGCYVGQEIVARTHYLGRIKRRMLRFACPLPCPPAGARILDANGASVGQVVWSAPAGAAHGELLAVLQLDARSHTLHLADATEQPLQPLDLPYAVPEP